MSRQLQYDDDYLDYDGDDAFADYAVTTLDGSPWILIATVVFCCSLYLFLPCVIALLNALDRRKRGTAPALPTNPEPGVVPQGAGLVDSRLLHSGSVIDPSSSVSVVLPFSRVLYSVDSRATRSNANASSCSCVVRTRLRKTRHIAVAVIMSARRTLPQQIHRRRMRELNL
jgi:hypothetical protein